MEHILMRKVSNEAKVPWDDSNIAVKTDKNVKNDETLEKFENGYHYIIVGGVLIVSSIFLLINLFIVGTAFQPILRLFGGESPGLGLGNILLAILGVALLILLDSHLCAKVKNTT